MRNSLIQIKFFLKGSETDIGTAKALCDSQGLTENVEWLAPMPLNELFEYYNDCDVCIDQVGHHWMGAVGAYALYCGRPLIANARPDVFDGIWGLENPVLQASSVEEIYEHLIRCENIEYRRTLSTRSHFFAAKYLDSEAVYMKYADVLLPRLNKEI